MLTKIKQVARQLGVSSYLRPLYNFSIKNPYWTIRRRFFPEQRLFVNGTTAKFSVKSKSDLNYHEFESEEKIISDIISELDNSDVFYDIGSNIGVYSCFIGQELPNNVVAFEPSPVAYEKLKENSEVNDNLFDHFQIAVSSSDDVVDFAVDVGDTYSRMSTLNISSNKSQYELHEIEQRRLDSFVVEKNLPRPTIVKIDVEGAEYDVLSGMEDIWNSVRIIYCEIHHSDLEGFGTSADEILDLIESKGFEIESLSNRGDNEFVKAVRI
jgi:FkbM family methyltransferase